VQISNGNPTTPSDWTQGYGYQFWRCRHGAYQASGVFGQDCIVMPEQDAVLAITGGIDVFGMQPPLNLVWDILLPAMSKAPLAEDAAAQQRLTEKLSSLNCVPVQGQPTSPIAAKVSGRTYKVDANDLKLEAVTVHFSGSDCTIRVKTAQQEAPILCGFGAWQRSQTALLNPIPVVGPMEIAANGAWTAEDRYTMVVRLYETPFYHTIVYHFVGEEMMIETWVNTSFGSLKPLLLTARAVQETV